MQIKVLVTGANGQLAKEIDFLKNSQHFSEIEFYFFTSHQWDITKLETYPKISTASTSLTCVINTAAYTAVDKAEQEKEKAYHINQEGVKILAQWCNIHRAHLVHISTDFVFDGTKSTPYDEEDLTNSQSVYGKSKEQGEQEILKINKEFGTPFTILRTSWLYGSQGNNFVKTMLNLAHSKKELKIIEDQVGTPTHAKDLAYFLCQNIKELVKSKKGEIYHFSNYGVASWYDFAHAIFYLAKKEIQLNPISTMEYSSLVKRPAYSVLSKKKISQHFAVRNFHWIDSLERFLHSNLHNS